MITAVGHVYLNSQYRESYPLDRNDVKLATSVFKRRGYDVKSPSVKIVVDDIVDLMNGRGSMSADDFQRLTGADIVSWAWGLDPVKYPNYIKQELGMASLPATIEEARTQEDNRNRIDKTARFVGAVENALYQNRERIGDFFWTVAKEATTDRRVGGSRAEGFTELIFKAFNDEAWEDHMSSIGKGQKVYANRGGLRDMARSAVARSIPQFRELVVKVRRDAGKRAGFDLRRASPTIDRTIARMIRERII